MRYLIIVTILALVGSFFFTQNANALTVSPPRIEVAGDSGQTIKGKYDLINEQDIAQTFYSSFENFEARGESGSPYFFPSNDGLATWISTDSQISLKGGEKVSIQYSIQIPKDAEPGGHFAAIFWGTSPPKAEDGQVSIGGKIGILILLKVSGETEESGGLLEFRAKNGRLLISLPTYFFYRFSNDGGDRIRPMGEIKIRNTFGLTSAIIDANKSEGNILPGSIRKFTALWHTKGQRIDDLTKNEEIELSAKISAEEKERKGFFKSAGSQWRNFAFGIYSAKLNISYGEGANVAEGGFLFFVLPWQLLTIILIVLAILGFFGKIGLKKYNNWIIKKHT